MELNPNEFKAMQGGFKEWVHEHLDFRALRSLGLSIAGNNVLEIGCGSGYGAELLRKNQPSRYLGIDVMPEQIELAQSRNVPNATFKLWDATHLTDLSDEKIDEIVVFRILHHIPEWQEVLRQCYQLLSHDGAIYIVEPYRLLSKMADLFLAWQHPEEALFRVVEFEEEMKRVGFVTKKISIGYGFAMCGVKVSK